MAFFSRPNLDNEQFKQISGSTLTLSGTTIIDKHDGGLVLTNDLGQLIPIVISGDTNQRVLTYITDGGSNRCLTLLEPTSGTSSGVYPYNECSTCTVGGLLAGSCLYNETIADILHDILVPVLQPTKVEPSFTFTLSCSPSAPSGYYEIGTSISITGCTKFNQGSVSPVYFGGPSVRSGLPTCHRYTNSCFSGGICDVPTTSLETGFTASYDIDGTRVYTGRVFYSSGDTILNSEGSGATFTTFCTSNPLPAGYTTTTNRCVCAVYPYFYGISDSTPTGGSTILSSGMCIVQPSSGSVAVNFNANNKYLWLAIPSGTTKTKWAGSNSVTNTESIPGGLFPLKLTVAVDSPLLCWNGIGYDFYISNYKTSTYEGITPYTITFTNS